MMLNVTTMLAAMTFAVSPSQEDKLPVLLDLERIRAIAVQYDGRWPPLDTAARDIVESIIGDPFYRDRDPLLWLLAWTFDPQTWMDEPLISIRNNQLRAELKLSESKSIFSYQELVSHEPLRSMITDLSRSGRVRKLNPLESKVNDIGEKLLLLQRVFRGQVIKPIPDADHAFGTWHLISESITGAESDKIKAADSAWTKLREAFFFDDASRFASASEELVSSLEALPAAYRPDRRLIETELRYNKLCPFHLAWMVMLVGALLAAGALAVRRKWFDGIAIIALITGFGVLTYGLLLRWQIAGRIPAANMFESLLFLSWGMGVFAILAMLLLRDRIIPLTASAMGALSLILADRLPLDHYIRPIVPVLMDTIWMSIHVPVIMISYAVLTLAALIAHTQLIVMAVTPHRRQLINTIDTLHYWYVHIGAILLLAGIITGSMWAASSWGRYWGWDPKEVWSLIAFLGYLTILHVRIEAAKVPRWAYLATGLLGLVLLVIVMLKLAPLTALKLLALAASVAAITFFVTARGQFATALKSVLAFWLIIMTYLGVNYVLGIGLHSYGFGTGAVVKYMFLFGSIDLLLIAICCATYLARNRLRSFTMYNHLTMT